MVRRKTSLWDRQINKLINYSNRKGFQVTFHELKKGDISFIDFKSNVISLEPIKNKEKKFYIFLHELGHLIQQSQKQNYQKRFAKVFNNFNRQSLTYKVAEIQEELDAWDEGVKLAKKLNLKIKYRNYSMLKSKCVSRYMRGL